MRSTLATPLTPGEARALRERLRALRPDQLAKLDLLALAEAVLGRRAHPLWNPLPGPQTLAYDSPADELFYGGAAGGGKTDLLVGLALTRHRRSLLLRRVAAYLKGLAARVQEIGGAANWRTSGHGGHLTTPEGRLVELGGCEQEKDKENYQGVPRDLHGFDEATHFLRSQVQFVTGWNRTSDPDQRCRVVLTGNPPTTPEGRWVVEEFAPWLDPHHPDPAAPGELRWYTTLAGKTAWRRTGEPFLNEAGELVRPKSRTFVPALLADNPFLDGTDYRSRIQALPEPLRSQMLYGDMNAGMEDDAWQVIPTAWVRAAQARWAPGPPEGFPLSCLGVDVARGGKDKTVIAPRYHHWFGQLVKIPGAQTPDGPAAAARVDAVYDGAADVNIDVTGGHGGSPYDILREKYGGKKVHGVVFSEGTDATDRSGRNRFINVRAAMYWAFREALDPAGEESLALPPDPELLADLCSARYVLLAGGIKVEAKEEIVRRLGRSPDCGDAAVLAYWRVKKRKFWLA